LHRLSMVTSTSTDNIHNLYIGTCPSKHKRVLTEYAFWPNDSRHIIFVLQSYKSYIYFNQQLW